jgi:hypothetical protein
VIVDDLDVMRAITPPTEADPPLIIDPDTELAGSKAFQRLQPIAGRDPQVIQARRNLELAKLAPRHGLDIHEAPDKIAVCQRLGIAALEGPDHG